ncbi:sarcosine oxidase subunit gamma [Spiribacter salilacus]|uniref:sarcosine oxidase subunit gamma n=1 Tax=Spiribacter salilacus TaxID=2664894 RepID=UPI0015629F7A
MIEAQRTHLGVSVQAEPASKTPTYNLRGNPQWLSDSVSKKLGLELPTTPNQVAANKQARLMWLSPDEWLLEAFEAEAADVEGLLSNRGSLVSVGHGLVKLQISGDQALHLLAAGTSLDLAQELTPGRCLQTRLAQVSVIITAEPADPAELAELAEPDADGHANQTPTITLWVRRSMAHYLWRWFEASLDRLEPGASGSGSASASASA